MIILLNTKTYFAILRKFHILVLLMSLNQIKRLLYQTNNNVKIKKNQAVLTMSTSSSCLHVNYCSWVNWPQHPFTPNIHQKSKKMWFANVSVVINSFFLDYGHVSHLIFTSSYVCDTHCSHNLNFAIFLYRQNSQKIRKFSCNKVLRFFIKFLSIFIFRYL